MEQPNVLLAELGFEVRSFTLTLTAAAGSKRGQGKSSFVGTVLELSNKFYETVVQNLKAWVPPAPKVKAPDPVVAETLKVDTSLDTGSNLVEFAPKLTNEGLEPVGRPDFDVPLEVSEPL
jgi:hypothetical protein